ncbi:unnamed protein product, partial [Symbiodinium necroappetens]
LDLTAYNTFQKKAHDHRQGLYQAMGDMSADVHKDGQANFGDIMQRSAGEVPIPPTLARKLKDTEWYAGDPFHGVVL